MPPKPISAHPSRQPGSASPSWKGGRTVTPDGYVLIKVGRGHPLADVRGYAYEHRLVASEKIGRWVEPHEKVHHKNEDKRDNRPENLEVCTSNAEHFVHHRKLDEGRRMPGEENPEVACACGCGATFPKFDEGGRPREYVSGHNPRPSPAMDAVLASLAAGPLPRSEIVKRTGLDPKHVGAILWKLKTRSLVSSPSRGVYRKEGEN